MHYTSKKAGEYFADLYGKDNYVVVDIGGADGHSTFRKYYTNLKMKYICVDLTPCESVDIVIEPGQKLPFADGSVDLVISSSCFEHDPCFWITFREMCRITKKDGFIYINAPSKGAYHRVPGDNWRFYCDAGQALAYWASLSYGNEIPYPVSVEETFHIHTTIQTKPSHWSDFVCIWKRTAEKESAIVVSDTIKNKKGPLRLKLMNDGLNCSSQVEVSAEEWGP